MKEGDEVVIRAGYVYSSYVLTTVKKITPTGRINVNHGDYKFHPHGTHIGGNYEVKLLPATQRNKEVVERQELLGSLKRKNLAKLTLEQLRSLKSFYEVSEKEKEDGQNNN